MADFCHDWEPGGLGCIAVGCAHRTFDGGQCFGDFTRLVREWAPKLEPGYEVQLGICEGHGGFVYLYRSDDGDLLFQHRTDDLGGEHVDDVLVEVGNGYQTATT